MSERSNCPISLAHSVIAYASFLGIALGDGGDGRLMSGSSGVLGFNRSGVLERDMSGHDVS